MSRGSSEAATAMATGGTGSGHALLLTIQMLDAALSSSGIGSHSAT